ncbi:MAG: hypothetical protein ACM4AI_03620, partial [Acidobacteriota bacterium]
HEEGLRLFEGLGHRRGIARLLEELARSASAQDRPARALRLAAAAAALRETIGSPQAEPAHSILEHALEPARSRLGVADSLAAWSEGRAMTLEKIVEYARQRES